MPNKLYAHNVQTLEGGCGVLNIAGFSFESGKYHWHEGYPELLKNEYVKSMTHGADLKIACFIDSPECKMAYEQLKERYNLVFQSTPRLNRNSGNMFYMCVYEEK